MNFYTRRHKHYCGIDLQTKAMYVRILNLPTTPEAFLRMIAPYREGVVGGVECMFTWYWLADLCAQEGIAFTLGHALSIESDSWGQSEQRQN